MEILIALLLLCVSYLLGAVPSGLVITWITTGKDVRKIESGRTGGTNVMRAAGYGAGWATAIADVLKSAITVWLARFLMSWNLIPDTPWLAVIPPVLAVLGHNYSIFLAERTNRGRLVLRSSIGDKFQKHKQFRHKFVNHGILL